MRGLTPEIEKEIAQKTKELSESLTEDKFNSYSDWIRTADPREVPNALEKACMKWYLRKHEGRLRILDKTYRASDVWYERLETLSRIAQETPAISKQHIADLKTIAEIESSHFMDRRVAELADKMVNSYQTHGNFTAGLDKDDLGWYERPCRKTRSSKGRVR